MRAERERAHISGAEGIFKEEETGAAIRAYIDRAMRHSKGRPDRIHLTAELLQKEPMLISSLPVCTLRTDGPADSKRKAARLLAHVGISAEAAGKAFRILSKGGMRGAALLDGASGKRFDPDQKQKRGVRASMLGISNEAMRTLKAALSKQKISHYRVEEALVLASKVASAPGEKIAAELCISDDPDYTTGYVASPALGYIRLPRIKKRGSPEGGRVFFLSGGASSAKALISYLEETPVIIGKISHVGDIISLHGLFACDHRKPSGKKVLRKKD